MGFAIFQAGADLSYNNANIPPIGGNISKVLFLTPEGDKLVQKSLRAEPLNDSEKKEGAALVDQLQAIPTIKPIAKGGR